MAEAAVAAAVEAVVEAVVDAVVAAGAAAVGADAAAVEAAAGDVDFANFEQPGWSGGKQRTNAQRFHSACRPGPFRLESEVGRVAVVAVVALHTQRQ